MATTASPSRASVWPRKQTSPTSTNSSTKCPCSSEHLTHLFEAATASLAAYLFPQNSPPPFISFTVFLLELSSAPFPSSFATAADNQLFTPLLSFIPSGDTLDLDRDEFMISSSSDAVVVRILSSSTWLHLPMNIMK